MRSIGATIFAILAICPLLIGGRTLLQGSEGVNLIATVTSDSVTFSGDDYGSQTVTMTGAHSTVPFQVTAGEPHGGVWDISQIAGKFIDGVWLGSPDAALYGYNNYGEQVVMLLGALSNPQLSGDTLTFNAQILSANDELARVNGVTNYVQEGKGGTLVTDPPVGPLNRIALMIDLAVAYPPQPAGSAYTPTAVQDLGAITRAPTNKRRGPFNTGRGNIRGSDWTFNPAQKEMSRVESVPPCLDASIYDSVEGSVLPVVTGAGSLLTKRRQGSVILLLSLFGSGCGKVVL